MIGNHTVHIRVKVPNLLISSNLRELVGGGLCSKGAERPGKVTIEKTSRRENTRSQTRGSLRGISLQNRAGAEDGSSALLQRRLQWVRRRGVCLRLVRAGSRQPAPTPRRLLPAGRGGPEAR